MDIRIKCPVCGLEMDLPQNMTAFSCPECGAQLYYLKGNVITKEQARTLLRKLIEKKQAEKENEQRIARISVRTVEKTVEEKKAPAEVKTEAPTPGIPYVGPAIQPSEKPKTENNFVTHISVSCVLRLVANEQPCRRTGERERQTPSGDKSPDRHNDQLLRRNRCFYRLNFYTLY